MWLYWLCNTWIWCHNHRFASLKHSFESWALRAHKTQHVCDRWLNTTFCTHFNHSKTTHIGFIYSNQPIIKVPQHTIEWRTFTLWIPIHRHLHQHSLLNNQISIILRIVRCIPPNFHNKVMFKMEDFSVAA